MWVDEQLPSLLVELIGQMRKIRPRATDHVVVGKVVRVTDQIPPGRLGAVLIPVRSGTEEFYARSSARDAIPAGAMVRVVAYAPPRTVEVEPPDRLGLTKTPL